MNRSALVAAGVAVAVAAWILSGQVHWQETDLPAAAAPPSAPLQGKPRIAVRVRDLAAEEWTDEIVLFGRTEVDRKVSLRAETSGQVIKHFVRKGERIDKGGRLLSLAIEDRNARLDRAKATLDHAALAHEAASTLSQKSFRSAVQVAETRADLERAKAELEEVKLDIARTVIEAPFAGTVERLPLEVGDYARVGDVVAEILDLDPIVVAGEVAEKEIGKLAVGQPALAVLVTGERAAGRVRYISRSAGEATRTFRVEVEMPNPDGCFAHGMTAELRLRTGVRKAHRVSPAVLTLSDEGVVGIKAVDEGGRVVFHPVEIVADLKQGMMIGGLPDRLRLITLGQEFVREGDSVEAVEERP